MDNLIDRIHMNTKDLKGFDPLESQAEGVVSSGSVIFEDATKRVIHNILRSYTGYRLDTPHTIEREREACPSAGAWCLNTLGALYTVCVQCTGSPTLSPYFCQLCGKWGRGRVGTKMAL